MNERKPGVYEGMPNDEYHRSPCLSSSALKLLAENPARYQWEYLLGNRREETPALLTGTVLHSMVLEPETVKETIAVAPNVDRRTKAGKAEWAKFQAENEGKQIITQADFDLARAMADSVMSHPKARSMLEGAICERSVFWNDDETGLMAMCRPDIWRPDIGVVADLKSTVSAAPWAFRSQAVRLMYHLSAAWYLRGIHAATGERPDTWAWIAVEKEAPHPVVVYVASDEMLAKGDELCMQALETYQRCRDADHWPAYTDDIVELELPAWAA
jgi:exodeoxyribonuclease VIII